VGARRQRVDVHIGHAEMIAVIERHIRALEGERRTIHPALAHLED
jgi:hypothetical protein